MQSVAFIGHAYHQRTCSSSFFLELLCRIGNVKTFFIEPGVSPAECRRALPALDDFDMIVLWQVHEAFAALPEGHPNVVFVPMYDAMLLSDGQFFWRPQFNQAKIVAFSWGLAHQATRLGATAEVYQYFPDPKEFAVVAASGELQAFFWYRRRELGVRKVFRLLAGNTIDRLTIHDVPDPGHEVDLPSRCPPNIARIEISGWTPCAADYERMVGAANVYVAPRLYEGIGMSFLEALARGQCVVAPNTATANEYISSGTNGILYDTTRLRPVDLSQARLHGARARDSVERGHRRWMSSQERLLDFLATNGRRENWRPHQVQSIRLLPRQTSPAPKVSVVTVCRNAGAALEPTIHSVASQKDAEYEYVILDGASTDETPTVIARNAELIDRWMSRPDTGPYDAMNSAMELTRGDFVLFMNAGDTFVGPDALCRLFSGVPDDADVVYGHHLYERMDGSTELHRVADFETTWSRLQRGELWFDWLAGMPGHQATAVRRRLLTKARFDPRYRIAADHDLLFRLRASGAKFFNADELVAVYREGGLSSQQYALCRHEWRTIARAHSQRPEIDRFFDHLDRVSEGAAGPAGAGLAALFLEGKRYFIGYWWFRALLESKLGSAARKAVKSRFFGKHDGATEVTPDEWGYGVDFGESDLAPLIKELSGFSYAEGDGRWTDGTLATITFTQSLPSCFDLELDAYAFEPVSRQEITMIIGSKRVNFSVRPNEPGTHFIRVGEVESGVLRIRMHIPAVMSTNELWSDHSSETRRLGIFFRHMRFLNYTVRSN